MRMKQLFYVLLYLHLGWSQLTTVQLGSGFIEDSTEAIRKCGAIEFQTLLSDTHFIMKTFQKKCFDQQKGKGLYKKIYVTISDEDINEIGLAVGRLALEFGVHSWQEEDGHSENLGRWNMMTDMWNKIERKSNFSLNDVQILINQLEQMKWGVTKTKVFEIKTVKTIIKHLKINYVNLLKLLDIDTAPGYDIFNSLQFSLVCVANESLFPKFQLQLCGLDNPTRKYGEVKLVAPIGNFISGFHAYKYYDVPRFAIQTSEALVPAEKCHRKIDHFECEFQKNTSCNFKDFKNCHTVLKMTPKKIFSFELGDSTYIATTQPCYRLFSNDMTEGKLEDVPRSGHFLFQAPRDHFIQFESILPVEKIHGRHEVLSIRASNSFEPIDHLNHADIDSWNERSKPIGGHLNDENLKSLHEKYGNQLDLDTLSHHIKWSPLISIVLLIVILLIIIAQAIAFISMYQWCKTVFSGKLGKEEVENGETIKRKKDIIFRNEINRIING